MSAQVEQASRRIEHGDVVTPQELQQFPFFQGSLPALYRKTWALLSKRRVKKGEMSPSSLEICLGDFYFYPQIGDSGLVEVHLFH